MTRPCVTVSIPTFNGQNYIKETINSVLDQSLQDFEILVFDDNSADRTQDIVRTINDPRIHYYRNKTNLGPEGNWNLGLKKAKGRYYKLLPHDDLLSKGCLERQVRCLEEDKAKKIALVFGAREVLTPIGQVLMSRKPFGNGAQYIKSSSLINRCVASGTNIIGEPGSGLIRTELLPRIGLYDATYNYTVDMDFWFRVLQFGDGFYTGQIDSAFRLHTQSWSHRLVNVQSQEFQNTVKAFARREGFKISPWSKWIGYMRSPVNAQLRRLFYHLYLR